MKSRGSFDMLGNRQFQLQNQPIYYSDRKSRAYFTSRIFSSEVAHIHSLLDVGCSQGDLEKYIPDSKRYIGIDISGKPDCYVNLEEKRLPFMSKSVDMIVCTEVLEHIDSIYDIFSELLRCSRKYVVISLPNVYAMFIRRTILMGRPIKFYGLPSDYPADRHKWFFSFLQARDFVRAQVQKYPHWKVAEEFPYFAKRNRLLNAVIKLAAKKSIERAANLFALTYWCLLENTGFNLHDQV